MKEFIVDMQNKNRTSYRKQEGLHELSKENSKRVNLQKGKILSTIVPYDISKRTQFYRYKNCKINVRSDEVHLMQPLS